MTLKDLIKAFEYLHYFDFSLVMFKDCDPPFEYVCAKPYYADHFVNVPCSSKSLEKYYDWHVMRLRIYEDRKVTFDLVDVR